MKPSFLFSILCLVAGSIIAQPAQGILLKNPSFEDTPAPSRTPKGWENCGFEEESPPDVQPNGGFGVVQEPAHGKTYLGMVVRDNDSWECAGQALPQPLLVDTCYHLTFKACRSESYLSLSRVLSKPANYTTPAVIRIWGGYEDKTKQGFALLAETEPIANTDWQKYKLSFTSAAPYDYLYLEAYYDINRPHPYNGNILVDELSSIAPCRMLNKGNK